MKKSRSTKIGLWSAIIWGLVVSVLFSILGAAIGASIVHTGAVRENAIAWLTILIWSISIFCGVMLTLNMNQGKLLFPASVVLGGYVLLNICVNILLCNEYFVGFGRLLLASLIGSGAALLLNFNKKKGPKRKIRYH